VALGVILYVVHLWLQAVGVTPAAVTIVGYLGVLNILLAAFNLLPAFPLDGGRILRAVLWHFKADLPQATRIASRIGRWLGLTIILVGLLNFFSGNFVGGMWWVLIGLFIRSAATNSYRQLLVCETLQDETVERFVNRKPMAVQPSLTIDRLVKDFMYRFHHKMFPVSDDGELKGCVDVGAVKQIDPKQWEQHRVAEVYEPCGEENTISPQTGAMQALATMRRSGKSRLVVSDHGRLVGIITLKDILNYLTVRLELEQDEALAGYQL
jgi:predicted transcriptional regulator